MTNQAELKPEDLDKVVGGAGYTMNRGRVWVNEDLCVCCGSCEDTCPMGAIRQDGDTYKIHAEECIECTACIDSCPVDAIQEG